MTKVLVADDHPVFRKGIISILSEYPEFEVVGEANSGEQAIAEAIRLQPDVILMDIRMSGIGGAEATAALQHELPMAAVLILTASEQDNDLFATIKAGAKGYLLKSAGLDELVSAIETIAAGEAIISPSMAVRLVDQFKQSAEHKVSQEADHLTKRERDVLQLAAEGATNKEIAAKLFIGETTVKAHLSSVLDKLHARNRAQAVALAAAKGLLK